MALKQLENFYKATIITAWTTGTGNFYVSTLPTVTAGYLVINPSNTTKREIIEYTAVGSDGGGNYVTVSSRGLGGTTEQTHDINEPIRMNLTAQHWDDFITAAQNTVTTLTDAATIAVDADETDIGIVTLGGNRTLGAPTYGAGTDGKFLEIRVRQDGTGSRTLAYNSIYRFGTDVPEPTLSTAADTTDYLLFQYNATDTKWDCLAVTKGY